MPAPVKPVDAKVADKTRDPLVIEAAWVGSDGRPRLTLILPSGLLRDTTGKPLPKTDALEKLTEHLQKSPKAVHP